ncbi:tRNA (adenosine(37)-N6)-threonylcarbamoyltransferase complex dimerization subunit type 1 TsaB [Sphingobacterium bambusae]|uniref:tRNA (Adenosine(37)-N6)-threonylcarbamoyltransferase complex dimerization subunit type 1 TsaB n=1 Tax=Sphingobacterium bambusae TaxID=662858 RepID=A0ABW6BJE3_9SPHI|nr:tRNA (adenosine(37)-N6)-threonylcarbamoyltransferase complex dimerization subunit type 1 TsaB [Sphingobacterium bambusae]WPL50151.1 tRNA (adenosine(37)-N6)-threonylcarbamoyltransferase complex dimerization subunit type 1 TsaB [Sphingobacterium bambusae]
MKDIFVLQIETATPVCAVAVSKNGKTVGKIDADEPNLHASHLTVFIDQLLVEAGIAMEDLDAVAVSMGPGSYTGLRIGVSTAKGLCYGMNIPLIAINTLDAMLAGFKEQLPELVMGNVLVPMIDARRMEVYLAKYDDAGVKIRDTEACIIDADFFGQYSNQQRFVLFGSGADKFETLFAEDPQVEVISHFANSADFLSGLAYEKYRSEQFVDLVYFEPFYLKDFIATTPKKR